MLPIPYQAQERPDGCAAAALCMAYRSLGLSCSQGELWPRVTAPVRGERRGKTHLVCRDALKRGLAAVVVRPASPWETLRECVSSSVRVILHHRLSPAEPSGHYSVLVGIDDSSLVMHDPLHGPARAFRRDEFLALWSPSCQGREVVGHVLVALSDRPGNSRCSYCHSECPESIDCALCSSPIRLRPVAVVGCLDPACRGRRFEGVYCPACDMNAWWLQTTGRGAWPTSRDWLRR